MAASDWDSLITLAEMLIWSGSPKEAFDPIGRARRLDPHNEAYHSYVKGLGEFSLGQFQHAAVSLEAAQDLNPEFLVPAAPLAATYAHLDRLPEARAALEPYCEDVGCHGASSEAHRFPFENDQVHRSLGTTTPTRSAGFGKMLKLRGR